MTSFKLFWNVHKWIGIIIALIVLNTAGTGFLLLMKKRVEWIQPVEKRGAVSNEFAITFDDIVEACRAHPELEVQSWNDIDRIDVRPGKGIVKVQAANSWEAQIDISNGKVLQTAVRRSDLIESIHDGSFFASWVHDWIWPASAICMVVLTVTGLWLWLEPKYRKMRRARNVAR